VMVIVILGILAAVAIPKFVDLSSDAKTAALQGVVGGIQSASAVNYASRSVNATYGTATAGVTCAVAATRVLQGGMPNGYTTTTPGNLAVGNNACTITQTSGGATATSSILGIN